MSHTIQHNNDKYKEAVNTIVKHLSKSKCMYAEIEIEPILGLDNHTLALAVIHNDRVVKE